MEGFVRDSVTNAVAVVERAAANKDVAAKPEDGLAEDDCWPTRSENAVDAIFLHVYQSSLRSNPVCCAHTWQASLEVVLVEVDRDVHLFAIEFKVLIIS